MAAFRAVQTAPEVRRALSDYAARQGRNTRYVSAERQADWEADFAARVAAAVAKTGGSCEVRVR